MRAALLFAVIAVAAAQTLPGTRPLSLSGDPAALMVDGIHRYLDSATAAPEHRHPSRERLAEILGAVDPRIDFLAPELVATTAQPALLARAKTYSVYRVRWPVFEGVNAEGLLFQPDRPPVARVVAIPDADETPEESGIAPRLAAQGCQVLSLAILNRRDTYSGNPKFKMTNQPHREYLYRMAFPVGRHIIGYEVEKILAAVDWFRRQPEKVPVAVWGYGAGGLLAFDAAALDPRIDVAVVSGYFGPREEMWREPIFRNVWGFLRDFGDAELAALMAPRKLIVETRDGPRWDGPSQADPKRAGAAPGKLEPIARDAVEREAARARKLGADIEVADDALNPFFAAIHRRVTGNTEAPPKLAVPDGRTHRQFNELVDYTQRIIGESEAARNAYWGERPPTQRDRDRVWNEMIGRLPPPSVPMNARSRRSYSGAHWDGYEVKLDVFPDVFAYGVLLLPKDLKPGERRPIVVCQHGLEGRPQSMFDQAPSTRDFGFYQNIGNRLVDLGFIVYLPQNPYIFGDRFRLIQRKANPLGLSLFSFILAQHARLLEWLGSLPFVDASRIGFYGLSYGGKTAVRVPPLLEGYALSICSGDFNEWVWKLTSSTAPQSYLLTKEWEMDEWNLAHVANYAELARLTAPRPFMVERGHRDGVSVDQWVAYEYAKVRRYYDETGIGDRTRIEFFNGPHQMHAVGTLEFLEKFLNWPPR